MKDIRKLALALLDTDMGINETAWDVLAKMLWEAGERDIVDKVKGQDGQFYLPEDAVAELTEE